LDNVGVERRVHAWDGSPELGMGQRAQGPRLGRAFIGVRGKMAAWALAAGEGITRGQNWGRGYLAVIGEAHRGASSARGRKMPPHGDFLRGRAGFCGLAGDLQGVGGSTWPGELSCAGLHWPTGLPAMEQGRGRREEGEGDGTYAQEEKIVGA
jgi:hypothetical protein